MLVAAGRRIERIEAVAEDARRVVGDEGVLAPPALTVHRIERVEIDQDAEAVRRRPEPRRAEAVDGLPLVRHPAEEALEAAGVDPVRPDLELRGLTGPVRDLEPVRAQLREPRREAEVRQGLRPALRRPVGPVGRLARGDDVRQSRAVVGSAAAAEPLPVETVVLAPPTGIVELELLLVCSLLRWDRV